MRNSKLDEELGVTVNERLRKTIVDRLRNLDWVLRTQAGLNVRAIPAAIAGVPKYLSTYRRFVKSYKGEMQLQPCLTDWFQEGGSTQHEYFWQDLLVAQWIHQDNPENHIDVGSRIDGFVANVASFRTITVLDIRQIKTQIPNVEFAQYDLLNSGSGESSRPSITNCDSISCLHVIEHIGLGRYGDEIDVEGYSKAIRALASLLRPGGKLYLSTPMGTQRVRFNANWIFAPQTILECAAANALKLTGLATVDGLAGAKEHQPSQWNTTLNEIAKKKYTLTVLQLAKDKKVEI